MEYWKEKEGPPRSWEPEGKHRRNLARIRGRTRKPILCTNAQTVGHMSGDKHVSFCQDACSEVDPRCASGARTSWCVLMAPLVSGWPRRELHPCSSGEADRTVLGKQIETGRPGSTSWQK